MLLTGHEGELYTVKFSPDGTVLASAGYDKRIFLWRTYDECENYMALDGMDVVGVYLARWCVWCVVCPSHDGIIIIILHPLPHHIGHKNAVLEVQWSAQGDQIYSVSADRTIRVWDAETGQQIWSEKGHESFINSCCPVRRGAPLLVSGSDDGTSKVCYDMYMEVAHGCFVYLVHGVSCLFTPELKTTAHIPTPANSCGICDMGIASLHSQNGIRCSVLPWQTRVINYTQQV